MQDHPRYAELRAAAAERILIIDGAMGSLIQQYELTEKDFRGDVLPHHPSDLKGNNEMLCITRPDVIKAIHKAYLDAGADILETNTFGATRIAQADYDTQALAYQQNVAAARIAREACDEATAANPSKPRFVAGALGPTNRTASISPDVNNPAFRAISFDELVEAYTEQINGLIDGGSDILLVETIFDTLNCKAALFAIDQVSEERGIRYPVMVSGTITDASGRTLSGQTTEAFWISVSHAHLFSVGLNCALGATDMRPYVETLARVAPEVHVSCYPNAGLPNEFGEYDETPHDMACVIEEFATSGLVNVVGGCCGTTPEHIRHIAEHVAKAKPRAVGVLEEA